MKVFAMPFEKARDEQQGLFIKKMSPKSIPEMKFT